MVNVLLLDTKCKAKVNEFEDTILTGPENVGRFEVGVDNAMLVEGEQSNKNVLGKLQTGPRRQASSLVLVNYLDGKKCKVREFLP